MSEGGGGILPHVHQPLAEGGAHGGDGGAGLLSGLSQRLLGLLVPAHANTEREDNINNEE